MAFRFTLAPILRLRQSLKRQQTLRLQEANAKVSRAQQAIAHMDEFLADASRSVTANLGIARPAADLHFATRLRETMKRSRVELETELRSLEDLRQQVLARYRQAVRECEALETLRSRQQREYQEVQSRRQQQELDAAHLLQRWHRRN